MEEGVGPVWGPRQGLMEPLASPPRMAMKTLIAALVLTATGEEERNGMARLGDRVGAQIGNGEEDPNRCGGGGLE